MEHRSLHSWRVTPAEAVALQKRLRPLVRLEPLRKPVRYVAGADISFERGSEIVYAAFVVIDLLKGLSVVAAAEAVSRAAFPYVPGLLSFREAPPLLEAWRKLTVEPDVVVFDGQGIAHPRRLGIASHMGLFIGRPSLGCGKSRLVGSHDEPASEAGSRSPLMHRRERVGTVLRTVDDVSPVFVSPGHLIDFEGAVRVLTRCSRGYRIPEPTRQAHLLVNRMRVEARAEQAQGRLFA